MSMNAIVSRVNRRMDTVIRKSTIELFGQVIKMTPVDTGRARGNWQCTVGSPATDETDRLDKVGSSVMSEVTQTVPKAGSVVWLSNNVPYIRKLEYGSSTQAPGGMVRIAIQNFGNIFADNSRKSLGEIR
jgi:hypothetical protein